MALNPIDIKPKSGGGGLLGKIGGLAGTIGGGIIGTAIPGVGTVAGASLGGALGGTAGSLGDAAMADKPSAGGGVPLSRYAKSPEVQLLTLDEGQREVKQNPTLSPDERVAYNDLLEQAKMKLRGSYRGA